MKEISGNMGEKNYSTNFKIKIGHVMTRRVLSHHFMSRHVLSRYAI